MRLEKYIHFRPTSAMVDIIIKTMVEVISILGIVTKEIRQSRTSMTCLIDITPKVHQEKPPGIIGHNYAIILIIDANRR